MHTMLATLTSTPELMISKEEASLVTNAAAPVLARYLPSGSVSQQAVEIANLVSALGAVYGSRAIAIYARKKAEKAKDVTPRKEATQSVAPAPSPQRREPRDPDAPTQEQREAAEMQRQLHLAGLEGM